MGNYTNRNRGRKKRRRKKNSTRAEFYIKAGVVILVSLAVLLLLRACVGRLRGGLRADVDASKPEIDVQLLDINEYSRPGIETNGINGVVIHYTANPGSSAQENRDYFEGLKDSHETSASSNFIVGLEGEIIQCIPTWEVAYASNERNYDTISIEVCHPDETGKFEDATYRSLVQLTAWLCRKYSLSAESVIRHYDVTGKNCPKYFVENEDAWNNFREDVSNAIAKGGEDE